MLGAEFRSLVEACDPWTADAVQLIASTGIRYGELMFLTVTDLDEDTLLIGYKELPYQMPEMVRRLLKDTSRGLWWPKDATDRVIPLTNMARDVLQRRVGVAARAGIPWLFANKAGNARAQDLFGKGASPSLLMRSSSASFYPDRGRVDEPRMSGSTTGRFDPASGDHHRPKSPVVMIVWRLASMTRVIRIVVKNCRLRAGHYRLGDSARAKATRLGRTCVGNFQPESV